MAISQRLKQARVDSGFATAAEAAEAFGWNVNTYRSHENGHRGIPADDLLLYSRAFRKPLAWLMTGRPDRPAGPPESIEFNQLPVLLWDILPKNREGIGAVVMRATTAEIVSVPGAKFSVSAFGLTMRDRSMVDAAESRDSLYPGDIAVIDPEKSPLAGRNALIFDEATKEHSIRRCRMLSAKRALFFPLNADFSSTELDLDSPNILGRVMAFLRPQY